MIDLEDQRVISTEQGAELAAKLNIPFLETSAKTKYNVDEAYQLLIRICPRKSEYKIVMMGTNLLSNLF
jgi:Fe2+ transport system protein B